MFDRGMTALFTILAVGCFVSSLLLDQPVLALAAFVYLIVAVLTARSVR